MHMLCGETKHGAAVVSQGRQTSERYAIAFVLKSIGYKLANENVDIVNVIFSRLTCICCLTIEMCSFFIYL